MMSIARIIGYLMMHGRLNTFFTKIFHPTFAHQTQMSKNINCSNNSFIGLQQFCLKRRSVRCVTGVLNDSDNATVKVDDHLEPLGYHLLHLTNKINWILKGFDQPPGKLTDFSNNSANSCCGVTQHLAIKVLLADADVFNMF